MTTTNENDTQEARSVQQVDGPPAGTRRERQEWWAVVDDQVKRVTGYSCGNHDKYWWCPKAGYSLMEGVHLFETEAEALDVAVAVAEREVVKRTEIVEKLKARRSIDQAHL